MNRRTFSFLALLALPFLARAASLSLVPVNPSVSVGETFNETIVVYSPNTAINAVSGELSFPSNKLRVVSLSKANSVMGLWVQDPSFSNTAPQGTVDFAGVALNPGWKGSQGTVITVSFKAIAEGNATIAINNGQVLANDGSGTNVTGALNPASITITPAAAVIPQQTPTTTTSSSIPAVATSTATTTAPEPILVNYTVPLESDSFTSALRTIIIGILVLILLLLVFILYLVEKHHTTVRQFSEKGRSKLVEDLKHLEADLEQLEHDLIERK